MRSILHTCFTALILVIATSSCLTPKIVEGDLHVIPAPQEVIEQSDVSPFVITSSTTIGYPSGNEKLARTADFLASYISETAKIKVKTAPDADGKNTIVLQLDSDIAHPEGYTLNIDNTQIRIKGRTEAGIFYGIQTIHKALPIIEKGSFAALPSGIVNDYPRFGYRGFLVDVGRHFFSVEYLKQIIDMLALHNINHFHWHLTEDQGWRIEIKKYPKLTEIGSYRKETMIKWGSDEYDGIPVSGFYTQDEAREIVKYAADRFITVIPEVDMPGHMLAALASYPELGCTGGPYEIPAVFGVFADVLCAGKEHTLEFAKDVLNEIMDIFPSEYIHIGGDECPKARWKECQHCQAKIRQLGLKQTAEHSRENQLQAWFMGEVEKTINARGRKMMAWDEILEGNPVKSTTVMAWTSVNAGIKSAQLQHKTIITPITHLYFSNPGYNKLVGIESVARVYNFEPVNSSLTDQEKENIIGAQGCIWTEWTKDSLKMEWQMMPRIAALSELQWSNPANKNLDDFLNRLRHQIDLYILKDYNFKQDIEDLVIHIAHSENPGEAAVDLKTFDNADVYYTTDGTEPSKSSSKYIKPIILQASSTIKACAIRNGRVSNTTTMEWHHNAATMRQATLAHEPTAQYASKKTETLLDGIMGDENFRSGRYVGFHGNDMDITIDLNEDKEVSSVAIAIFQAPRDHLFGLAGIEVYGGNDPLAMSKIASKEILILGNDAPNDINKTEELQFDMAKVRYIRIVGKVTPTIPEWHKAKGQKAFLFVDEVMVK